MAKASSSVEQWTDAWLVFASVYLERHPAEAVGILRYAEIIRDMSRRGPYLAWRQYDEQFRQAKAVHPLPWGAPLGYLYLRCMTPRKQKPTMLFRPKGQWQRNASHRFNKLQGRSRDQRYPLGYTAGTSRTVSPVTELPACTSTNVQRATDLTPEVGVVLEASQTSGVLPSGPSLLNLEKLDPGRTPVNVKVLKALLRGYDVQKCDYLIQGFANGYRFYRRT